MASRSGEARAGHLRRAASWLVFKKRAGSVGQSRLMRRRPEERLGRVGAEESCVASSVEFGDEGEQEGWQASARPLRPATRRGESARELSVPKRLVTSSAPVSYSFTAVRNGWIHSRVSRLFARWATEDTPAVPLVPRFSAHTLIPNKEAYFNDETDTVTCCSPSPGPDDAAGDGATSKRPYLCRRCRMHPEMETVRVDMRVVSGGDVRVSLQAVKSWGWDSDTLMQRDRSRRILDAMPSSKKRPPSPRWGCILQLFAMCRHPQILV
eukprot:evm.model.scf_2518.1 EVM.evm.TU.scf_2518.1   scf_2518:1232-4628(+)